MPKLVQKSGYIKGGGGGGYIQYISTRDGVEKLSGQGEPTKNQKKLIAKLLRDFPDTSKLFEYDDYRISPSFTTASAFISMALDSNIHSMKEGDVYMQYISTRPGVEMLGDHGLFGRDREVSLEDAMREAQEHTGNEWTLIFSLRREDATRLGYDNAEQWRSLLLRHQGQLADAMKIPPDQLRWYAAFHDEGSHPHIHMMVWSADPKKGFLTKVGITSIRSMITNDIFQGELQTIYKKKDISYKEVTAAARKAMGEVIRQMENSICDSPSIEEKMVQLAQSLESVTGKKVYGYLKPSVKVQVDAIVDELAKLSGVAEFYEVWNKLRDEVESYYKDTPRERLPLSQQKEFRSIKNMVIREADGIRQGVFTFEDEKFEASGEDDPDQIPDEKPDDIPGEGATEGTDSANRRQNVYEMAKRYWQVKSILQDRTQPQEFRREALHALEQLWEEGYTLAAHQLGKVWRDGLCDPKNIDKAEQWFRLSAESGNSYSQYALGKLLQDEGRIPETVSWYERASEQGNQYANYRLGKLYLIGKDMPKDAEKAVEYLSASAEAGNQYAQYALGKLYLMGQDVSQDRELAEVYLTKAAEQGNEYARFLLNRMDQYQNPSAILAATRLLYHLSRIFRQNSVPPTNPVGMRIDSKRRRMIIEKRLAMGHKPDDHENQPIQNQSM